MVRATMLRWTAMRGIPRVPPEQDTTPVAVWTPRLLLGSFNAVDQAAGGLVREEAIGAQPDGAVHAIDGLTSVATLGGAGLGWAGQG